MNNHTHSHEDLLAEVKALRAQFDGLQYVCAPLAHAGPIPCAGSLDAAGELATIVSHRFNGLLMVILSAAEFIRDSLSLNSQAYRDVEELLKATREAIDLARKLRAFSGQEKLAIVSVDLNELVDGMADMLARLAGPDIEVRLRLAPGGAAAVADAGQLHGILCQLVRNAAEAMPTGGVVTLETAVSDAGTDDTATDLGNGCAVAGTFAVLSVCDSGSGVSPALLGKILQPFVTTKPNAQGLGLSAAYGVIRQHGGHLAYRPAAGGGAEFRIYIPQPAAPPILTRSTPVQAASPSPPQPVQPPAPSPPRPVQASAPSPPRPDGVAVLVEDEEDVRRMTARRLAGMGYEVLQAPSAEHALALLAERRSGVQFVLADVGLPGMDGKALADELARLYPDLPVILASGYPGDLLEERGIGKRVAVLMKPFSREELANRIEKALGQTCERPSP